LCKPAGLMVLKGGEEESILGGVRYRHMCSLYGAIPEHECSECR
jgi:hypothetical protein